MQNLRTPAELATIVSKRLQQLEERAKEGERTAIYVPKGVIRKMDALLPKYILVSDSTVKRNICYAMEALDFYRWLINRFKLYGPVEGYLYKTGIILANMIVEAVTRDFLTRKWLTPSNKHLRNIDKLEQFGIPAGLCKKMHSLNSRRENIHLHLVSDLESAKYTLKDWNESILCLQAVRGALLQ
jgi:hypothetical protein